MAHIDVEGFITEQLDRAGIPYQLSKSFVNIGCTYHEHSGRKKKLGFSKTSGGMHCFVCGKEGHWNEYAKEHGLETFGDDDVRLQDFKFLKGEFDRIVKNRVPSVPDWMEPWPNKVWRGLSPDFLATVPSYKWYDETSKAQRILWPVFINDQFRGCTAAKINWRDTFVFPKTRNLGGMDSKKILFPFDHPRVRDSKVIVLTEGQFDALRLLYHGVPAVSIIGAGAWDTHKLSLIAARGVERIVLAFDGDLAGEKLSDRVYADAEREFDTRVMYFPDPTEEELENGIKSIDPGNCNKKLIRVIKRLCR